MGQLGVLIVNCTPARRDASGLYIGGGGEIGFVFSLCLRTGVDWPADDGIGFVLRNLSDALWCIGTHDSLSWVSLCWL